MDGAQIRTLRLLHFITGTYELRGRLLNVLGWSNILGGTRHTARRPYPNLRNIYIFVG